MVKCVARHLSEKWKYLVILRAKYVFRAILICYNILKITKIM